LTRIASTMAHFLNRMATKRLTSWIGWQRRGSLGANGINDGSLESDCIDNGSHDSDFDGSLLQSDGIDDCSLDSNGIDEAAYFLTRIVSTTARFLTGMVSTMARGGVAASVDMWHGSVPGLLCSTIDIHGEQ
jgi:hypothetical protein